ncbi:hypothetical protein [Mycobacteroides sp. LB1]|uniref:hypothetical protein n=1 Tax=Mycobacteroides sp. LB1 TaxID=2750814 RepID=UPI0015DE7A1D|nr:hypothetical protein [Mycobacteroides sp. LB1]
MRGVALPRPVAWRGDRTALSVAVSLAFIGAAVPCGIKGVESVTAADYPTATIALAAGAALVLLAGTLALVAVAQSITPLIKEEHDATLLLPDRKVQVLYRASFLTGVTSTALFAILVPLRKTSFHLSEGGYTFYPIWAGVIAVLLLIPLVRSLRREGMCYVHLTVSGIKLDDGYSSFESRWTDIKKVADSTPKSKGRRLIVFNLADDTTRSFNATGMFTPGGVALYWMIRHYWKHPEDRAELADGRALDRLRDERFDTTVP